ncbi:MAG: porin family protein [Bacteroidota bacterium]
MKKLMLIALFSAFIVFESNAQAGFRVGVKGGLNFADFNTDLNTSSRTGYHAGAFATIKIAKIAIQPELIFSSQGSQLEIGNLDATFNYVNIPVMLKFYLIAGLNLQAGPQFGFLTSARQDLDLGNGVREDVSEFYKSSDVSIGLGAGWDLPFGLTVDARYNLGVSEISDSEAVEAAKNQVFQVSLGYRIINLGK